MDDLREIRDEISYTQRNLASAQKEQDRDLVLMYGNTLIEQLKKENFLMARSGNLIKHEFHHQCLECDFDLCRLISSLCNESLSNFVFRFSQARRIFFRVIDMNLLISL